MRNSRVRGGSEEMNGKVSFSDWMSKNKCEYRGCDKIGWRNY